VKDTPMNDSKVFDVKTDAGGGFTPGPWSSEPNDDDNYDVGTDTTRVCDVSGFWGEYIEEGKANARLIAAAPGMYAVCRKFAALYNTPPVITDEAEWRAVFDEAMQELEAVLAAVSGSHSEPGSESLEQSPAAALPTAPTNEKEPKSDPTECRRKFEECERLLGDLAEGCGAILQHHGPEQQLWPRTRATLEKALDFLYGPNGAKGEQG
jgi:hypothetical protein